jgi:hypothetical protein
MDPLPGGSVEFDSPAFSAAAGIVFFIMMFTIAIFPVFMWGILPSAYYTNFDAMSYVNKTGLTQQNFSYSTTNGQSLLMGEIITIYDPETYSYYNLKVIEGPDTGPVIPWAANIVYNETKFNSSISFSTQLNPCVATRIILVTDRSYAMKEFNQTIRSYAIKEFNQTMICG